MFMQQHLQQARLGNNPSAHQQIAGLRRCDTHSHTHTDTHTHTETHSHTHTLTLTHTHTHTHTHTVEYYSVTKNEALPFVATWMDLENIV